MPEEVLFKTEKSATRTEVAEALRDAAAQIESGPVESASDTGEQTVTVPEESQFEVELERLTDSETGEQRYELEYEVRWTE